MVEREKKGRPTAMSGDGGAGEHQMVAPVSTTTKQVFIVQLQGQGQLLTYSLCTCEDLHMMLADAFGSRQKLNGGVYIYTG